MRWPFALKLSHCAISISMHSAHEAPHDKSAEAPHAHWHLSGAISTGRPLWFLASQCIVERAVHGSNEVGLAGCQKHRQYAQHIVDVWTENEFGVGVEFDIEVRGGVGQAAIHKGRAFRFTPDERIAIELQASVSRSKGLVDVLGH